MASDDELDIDLGGYLGALARSWWIVLVIALVGMGAAVVFTLAQPKTYQATSAVYLGQPTDATGAAITGLQSNAKAAGQIVTAEGTFKDVAGTVGQGETVRKLRDGVTVAYPTTSIKGVSSPANFATVTVTDTKPARAAAAANALAAALVAKTSTYADQKTVLLTAQLKQDQQQIAAAQARSAGAQAALRAIGAGGGTAAEKAASAAPYVGITQAAATELQALLADKRDTALMLQETQSIEKPYVISPAVPPASPSGPSLALNAAAGLLVGLVVGIVVALVLAARRRPAAERPPAAAAA